MSASWKQQRRLIRDHGLIAGIAAAAIVIVLPALAWPNPALAADITTDHQCQLFGYVFGTDGGSVATFETLCALLYDETLPDTRAIYQGTRDSVLPAARLVSFDAPLRASPSRDGWGFGYFFAPPQPGILRPIVIRAGPPACEDVRRWNDAVAEVSSFGLGAASTVIGHVRKSSYGPDNGALPDPHPFADSLGGRWWLFAHNGHMVPDTLLPWIPPEFLARHPLDYDEVLIDSEVLFRYCMYEIERQQSVRDGLLYTFHRVKSYADFVFNICLTDGDTLWVAHSISYTPVYYESEGNDSAWWASTVRGSGYPATMGMHRLYWFTSGDMGWTSYE